MRKMGVLLLVLCLTIISLPAFAAKGRRGASDRAYERASQQASFHRSRDWVPTREGSKQRTKLEKSEGAMPGKGSKGRKRAKRAGR